MIYIYIYVCCASVYCVTLIDKLENTLIILSIIQLYGYTDKLENKITNSVARYGMKRVMSDVTYYTILNRLIH